MCEPAAARKRDWLRGYYCAVAVLLREAGNVTAEVRSGYEQGGDASQADPHDAELFAAHGLHTMTSTRRTTQGKRAARTGADHA